VEREEHIWLTRRAHIGERGVFGMRNLGTHTD
jgi:predicted nucleotidyltransferase